jgi:hypothetical protein
VCVRFRGDLISGCFVGGRHEQPPSGSRDEATDNNADGLPGADLAIEIPQQRRAC